jgi:hypothetical protein
MKAHAEHYRSLWLLDTEAERPLAIAQTPLEIVAGVAEGGLHVHLALFAGRIEELLASTLPFSDFARARAIFQTTNPKPGHDLLERMYANGERPGDCAYELAIQNSMERNSEALEWAKRGIAAGKRECNALFGFLLAGHGHHVSAVPHFALSLPTDEPVIHLNFGYSLRTLGDFSNAEKAFRLAVDFGLPEALLPLASTQNLLGQTSLAQMTLLEAVRHHIPDAAEIYSKYVPSHTA